jgi:hypothetical protein
MRKNMMFHASKYADHRHFSVAAGEVLLLACHAWAMLDHAQKASTWATGQ